MAPQHETRGNHPEQCEQVAVTSSFVTELGQEFKRIMDGSDDSDITDSNALGNVFDHRHHEDHTTDSSRTVSHNIEKVSPADSCTQKFEMRNSYEHAGMMEAGEVHNSSRQHSTVQQVSPQPLQQATQQPSQRDPLTSKERLTVLGETTEVPEPTYAPIVGAVRHTYFSVYKRLHFIVLATNIACLIWFLVSSYLGASQIKLTTVGDIASGNICLCTLVRQDYIVNILFKTCWYIPHSAPLRLRRIMAKIYENGGVHSGAALSGVMWFIVLVVLLTLDQVQGRINAIPELVLSYGTMILLTVICLCALPMVRNSRHHNAFQYSHRYAGWTAIITFWVTFMLIVRDMARTQGLPLGSLLIEQPTLWFLLIITIHAILPWLFLRKWDFEAIQLSANALHLRWKNNIPALSGIAIAEHPLKDFHPFASFPNWLPDSQGNISGGSMIISCAGDWTRRNVTQPRTQYWVKGFPKTGVLSMGFIFRRIVVVTTGAGLGPCLSFLVEPSRKTDCKVIWSTQDPLVFYGPEWVDAVHRADPEAIIINTKSGQGRVTLGVAAYNLCRECDAEAVFVISNPKTTKELVYFLESRGIPAFGPIWDS